MIIYTAEIAVFDVPSLTASILYLSTAQLVTKSTDTPANTAFDPRIIDPGSIGIRASEDGVTFGQLRLEIGELVIANIDGAYDYLVDYKSLAGRAVIIRYGDDSSAYPSGFTTLFKGTCDGFEITYDKFIINLRDNSFLLDDVLITDTYAGNNALPAGIEGTPSDLKGTTKPWGWGTTYNVTLSCCNTSKLIYTCNYLGLPSGSPAAVYDNGVALTAGADYANQAAMESTAPAAGAFRRWLAGGCIRLGSTPSGDITADIINGSSAALRTVAQTMKSILALQSITPYASDVSDLDTACSYEVGINFNDEIKINEALNQVSESIGVFYYYDNVGNFRIKRFIDPGYLTQTIFLYEEDVINIERIATATIVPSWKARLKYQHNETVQKMGDLAGAVTTDRRAFLAKPYRFAAASDTSVKSNYKTSKILDVNSRLITEADASAEAARRLDLYDIPRSIYEVTIPISKFSAQLMDGVYLKYPRFVLDGGSNLVVLGYTLNLAENNAILILWG